MTVSALRNGSPRLATPPRIQTAKQQGWVRLWLPVRRWTTCGKKIRGENEE